MLNCKLVTPPPPCFLKVIDTRGVTAPVNLLESTSLKLMDSKGVGEEGPSNGKPGRLAIRTVQYITYSNMLSRKI